MLILTAELTSAPEGSPPPLHKNDPATAVTVRSLDRLNESRYDELYRSNIRMHHLEPRRHGVWATNDPSNLDVYLRIPRETRV